MSEASERGELLAWFTIGGVAAAIILIVNLIYSNAKDAEVCYPAAAMADVRTIKGDKHWVICADPSGAPVLKERP